MKITDWEQCYNEGNTPWDKGMPSPPLVDWLARRKLRGRVLVPGCGSGHDVAHLRAHGAEAIGLDLAPSAVARARTVYPAHADHFVLGDLFAVPNEWGGGFDAVVEHTCLCAMSPELRIRYREAVLTLLKPGGLLVGVWYINPEMDPGESGPPFGIDVESLDALFGEHFLPIEDYVPRVSYPGREGRERVRVLQLKRAGSSR